MEAPSLSSSATLPERCFAQATFLASQRLEATNTFVSLLDNWVGFLYIVLRAHKDDRFLSMTGGPVNESEQELLQEIQALRQEAMYLVVKEVGEVSGDVGQLFSQIVTEREGWGTVAERLESEFMQLHANLTKDEETNGERASDDKTEEDKGTNGNNTWTCSTCTYKNEDNRATRCAMCKAARTNKADEQIAAERNKRTVAQAHEEALKQLEESLSQWHLVLRIHLERYDSLRARVKEKHRLVRRFVEKHGFKFETLKGDEKENEYNSKSTKNEDDLKRVSGLDLHRAKEIDDRWKKLEEIEKLRESQQLRVSHLERKLEAMGESLFGKSSMTSEEEVEVSSVRAQRVLKEAQERHAGAEDLPGEKKKQELAVSKAFAEMKGEFLFISALKNRMREEVKRLEAESNELKKKAEANGMNLELQYLDYYRRPDRLEKVVCIQKHLKAYSEKLRQGTIYLFFSLSLSLSLTHTD